MDTVMDMNMVMDTVTDMDMTKTLIWTWPLIRS